MERNSPSPKNYESGQPQVHCANPHHSINTKELYYINENRIEIFFSIESNRLLLIKLDSKGICPNLTDDTIPVTLKTEEFNIHQDFTFKRMARNVSNFENSIKSLEEWNGKEN